MRSGIQAQPVSGLDRYRDLVFSPLALASPPDVDADRLMEWMTWARVESRRCGLNRSERRYEAFTGEQYPWLMATVSFDAPGQVEASFGREFPEVADYAAQFPLHGRRVIVLLAQREQSSVFLHTDVDGYWGFRFYLKRKRGDALYFCKARARIDKLPSIAPELSSLVDETRRHYARWPDEERAYCVNSVRAAHAVEVNACRLGERVACLVRSTEGPDEDRLLPLLDQSSKRFRSYQIWYED